MFDEAVVHFAESYAAQNRDDYSEFKSQIDDGQLAADMEH